MGWPPRVALVLGTAGVEWSLALAAAIATFWTLACSDHSERDPRSMTPTTPLPTPSAGSASVSRPENPLLVRLRNSFGSNFGDVAVVETHPAGHHGNHTFVLARAVTRDSTATVYDLLVTDSAGTIERRVATMTAPWPDYTLQVDRVTPESVYVTGRSAGYRRTLHRAYEWWPLTLTATHVFAVGDAGTIVHYD